MHLRRVPEIVIHDQSNTDAHLSSTNSSRRDGNRASDIMVLASLDQLTFWQNFSYPEKSKRLSGSVQKELSCHVRDQEKA